MTDYLPYGHQWIDDDDVAAVVSVLKSDWLTQGPTIDLFERSVADYVGVAHAVAFCNGTAALHGAYYAAEVDRGDEVIVPPLTFAATANAACYLNAIPVFADISPETFCLDPAEVAKEVTERTRVVVPVSYAGYPADVVGCRRAAPDAVIVEDGCHALGGDRKRRKIGFDADMTVFSFHPVKHVTTGEGGMVVTDDDAFAKRLRLFRSHGITKDRGEMEYSSEGPWYTEMVDLGYNYRLTELQAALGLSQMKRLDAFVARRRHLARLYDEALGILEDVKIPPRHEGHAYHLYPIQLPPPRRKEIFEALRAAQIGVQVHYFPVHLHPYYRHRFGFAQGECPHAESFYKGEISLPLFPAMEDGDVYRVVSLIRELLEKAPPPGPKSAYESYEEELDELKETSSFLSTLERMGIRKGRKEGFRAGRQEGRQEGRKEALLESAQKMLGHDLAPAQVADILDLPLEQVLALQQPEEKAP